MGSPAGTPSVREAETRSPSQPGSRLSSTTPHAIGTFLLMPFVSRYLTMICVAGGE